MEVIPLRIIESDLGTEQANARGNSLDDLEVARDYEIRADETTGEVFDAEVVE